MIGPRHEGDVAGDAAARPPCPLPAAVAEQRGRIDQPGQTA